MQLHPVDIVQNISAEEFKKKYYLTSKPLVIKSLSQQLSAYSKWNWDYF